jgi:hypothetical protein
VRDSQKSVVIHSGPSWLWPALLALAALLLLVGMSIGRVIDIECGSPPLTSTQCTIVSHSPLFDWSRDTFYASEVENAYVGVSGGGYNVHSQSRTSLMTLSLIVERKGPQTERQIVEVPDYSFLADSDEIADVAKKILEFSKHPASGPFRASLGDYASGIVSWLVLLVAAGGVLLNICVKTLRVSQVAGEGKVLVQCYGLGSRKTGVTTELPRSGLIDVQYDAEACRFVARYNNGTIKDFPRVPLSSGRAARFAGDINKLLKMSG